MRFWTTIFLLVLTAGAIGVGRYHDAVARRLGIADPAPPPAASVADLQNITPATLTRLELGPDIQLERAGAAWNLPGEWPTRQAEVQALVATLTGLETRFAPVPMTDPKALGLDPSQRPVVVKATAKLASGETKTYTLTFGEPPTGAGNPFIRPTYVHVDDAPEALRLAPGLITGLRKNHDDFLRRQLFPEVVRAKISGAAGEGELPPAAVALIDAKEISVTGPDGAWTIDHKGDVAVKKSTAPVQVAPEKLAAQWQLTSPHKDAVEAEKLRGVLAAVPDLWAEQFVSETDPAKTGLDAPERTVTVKTPERELKVLIGKVSRVKETKPPAPPQTNPFAPPPPPLPALREEWRYAKLPNNPRVFEIRTDKFTDLFAKPVELREAKVAAFRPADVKSLEVALPDRNLVFNKEKDAAGEEKWRITAPVTAPAETGKVVELLERLADLQARGPDVIDSNDLKPYGLDAADPATTINVTVAEGDAKRTIKYRLGKADAGKKKLYLQGGDSPRVNFVADDLLKLVDRPVLAYRGRRVLDADAKQFAKITVDRPADPYSLTNDNGTWSLATPAAAKADAGKAGALAGDLAKLEAVEYLNFTSSPDDLKTYGLDAPTAKATVTFTDAAKPAQALVLGKAREGKPEWYAKMADAPEVFTVRQAVKDAVDQPSLAFHPSQLWQATGARVTQIAVERAGEAFTLSRDGAYWKIAGPFAATAFLPSVQPLLEAAISPRAERFVAHGDDLAQYGLAPPAITLRVTLSGEKPGDPATEKVLMLGKPVSDTDPNRYAKLGGQPGVFVLAAAGLDKPALDFLDRKLLGIDPRMVVKLEGTGPGGPWSAVRDGEKWRIDSLTPPAAGDRAVLEGLANAWTEIRAPRFAAYAPADFGKFGLDKPWATVTVSTMAGDKPVTHTIALGNPVELNPQARYARLDGGPAVAELMPGVTKELGRTALELVDRAVLTFEPRDVTAIHREGHGAEVAIEKKDGAWQIVKPPMGLADDGVLNEMTERLGTLRALRVAELSAKDLAKYGLDNPEAIFTLTLTEKDGRPKEMSLKVGGTAAPDGRYAQAGTDTVYVLPDTPADPLAARLLADPIKFRDRSILRFNDADRVVVARGPRTATFARVEGAWKMTAPVAAEAESFDLDDLILAATKLRGDELLTEKAGDLKPYGLDKPDAELKFFQGDKEVAKLLLGKRDPDGRLAVKSAASDVVAKLEAGIAKRVSAEFRKRQLWANIDAAQAETLIVNSGGAPLTLVKTDAGWQNPAKPEQPVKPEAVNELLAALAGLKADHFAADQKADLKLYGLDAPARTIVMRTRAGQTATLNLGRNEGDSKRAYASSPERPGEVVVLSEGDTAKVMTVDFAGK